MKNILLLFVVCYLSGVSLFGQKHKIVFQFTNANDTLQQKAFTRQLNNLMDYWPKAQVEVVSYNNGIDYMMTQKTKHAADLEKLVKRGVKFMVCQNTMNQRNIKPEDLLPLATIVPSGIVYLVERQEKGWSYVRGGF
jgi:uncharacterized protein